MDRTTERALKRAVRDEAAVRLRGDAVGPDAVEALIRRLVEEIASESGISLPPYEFEGLASAMIDDFLRYGPLQRLLEDESVTEIMVNGGGIDLDDPALSKMCNDCLIVFLLKETLESKLNLCLNSNMFSELFRISSFKKDLIFVIILFY